MRLTALCLAAALLPTSLQAGQQPIEEAFGIKLGEVIDVSQWRKVDDAKDGGIVYEFTPAAPYQPLTHYAVFVTSSTHTVYKIVAKGRFNSMKKCRAELVRLEQILSKKYLKTSGKISSKFGDMPRIRFGKPPRTIEGICKGVFNRKELVLSYIDESVDHEAIRETEQPQQERDTSGL